MASLFDSFLNAPHHGGVTLGTGTEADQAHACSIFNACSEFVSSLGVKTTAFNTAKDICFCSERCSKRHPDTSHRGGRTYGLPKGWCGFGLRVDEAVFEHRNVFNTWNVAFHGTKKDTAVEILNGEWQLLRPGEVTATGFTIPIREGHIKSSFRRWNDYSKTHEDFNPNQIFTSPSIKYCSYGSVYCDKTMFQGSSFEVVFQLRQMPESYSIGQHTFGASVTGQIDPLFDNNELEYYTVRNGVHKIYRLLVRRTGDALDPVCTPPSSFLIHVDAHP
jgi:hypothetical protein